ncbi:MAG: PEGA domain-containing protein [Candidatus Neomarinimicrobiota bacterium]
MLKNMKHITIFASLIVMGIEASVLEDIKYDPKSNGLMISIEYSDPIPDDNIIGWKSDRNWLYITLLGVKHTNDIIPKPDPNNLIKELVIDSFDESVQIAVLLTKKIHWYDIINSKNTSSAVVFIHTEMKNSMQANLKKHLDKSGKSVFSVISQEGFPTYNTSFQAAFNKAREELGANAIFKFKGKLYHTNHPSEVSQNLVSGTEDLDKVQNINDIFSNYAKATVEIDKKDYNRESLSSEVDEYFIDKDSGEELTEWSDLIEKKNKEKTKSSLSFWDKMTAAREDDDKAKLFDNLGSSKGQLIEELADHSIINDNLDGRIIKIPKTSWWQKLPFASITKSKFGVSRKPKNEKELLLGQSAIRVDANLEGVPIYIDGRYVGHTPLKTPIRVEPGWHQVSGFSPQYLMYLNTGTIDYVSNDPMLQNQIFGTETIYVEGGKIARSEMRFDYVGPSLPVKKKDGGWLVGFPILLSFFSLIAWGVA